MGVMMGKWNTGGLIALVGVCMLAAGCTSVQVKRADPSSGMRHVCIQDNPRVTVPGFLGVLRDGIARNGLTSEVYEKQKPAHCEFVLTYTALRSWDLGTYLSHAELRIERQGQPLASAQYHLRGKGGLSLAKWQGVESKMDPVIDELFANYRGLPRAQAVPQAPAVANAEANARANAQAGTNANADVATNAVVHAPAAPDATPQPLPRPMSQPQPAASAATQAATTFTYSGDASAAARALATSRNCATGFQAFSQEDGRQVFSATCWGNRKLLVACEQGSCRELR